MLLLLSVAIGCLAAAGIMLKFAVELAVVAFLMELSGCGAKSEV